MVEKVKIPLASNKMFSFKNVSCPADLQFKE